MMGSAHLAHLSSYHQGFIDSFETPIKEYKYNKSSTYFDSDAVSEVFVSQNKRYWSRTLPSSQLLLSSQLTNTYCRSLAKMLKYMVNIALHRKP
jgi:hypothetical protein